MKMINQARMSEDISALYGGLKHFKLSLVKGHSNNALGEKSQQIKSKTLSSFFFFNALFHL